jgi:hypothetical protein
MVLRKKIMLLTILSFVLLAGTMLVFADQSPADFYKGKTITIIEGFGAGSDFDIQARLLAPFLQEATGARAVMVENRSGGAGLVARNWLYNEGKNDGLTIMLDHGPRNIQNSLFQTEGVEYTWQDFAWIGKIVEENVVFVIDKSIDADSIEDLAGERLLVGVSRPFYEPLFLEALGLDEFKLIPGYPAVSERVVGIARGEIQSSIGNAFSFLDSFDIVKPLAISYSHKEYPGVPALRELVPADRTKWVDYIEAFHTAQYSFIAPPGTPDDRLKFLEECLHVVYDNPETEKALDSLGKNKTSEFIGSNQLAQITQSIANMNPEEISELKHLIEEKYMILK